MRSAKTMMAGVLVCTLDCTRKASTLEVDNAVIQTGPGDEWAAIYRTVTSGTPHPDRLVSVDIPIAKRSVLHETVTENGMITMVHRDTGCAVAAGATLTLEPGAQHVMLFELPALHPGAEKTELILTFERAGVVKARARIRSPGD